MAMFPNSCEIMLSKPAKIMIELMACNSSVNKMQAIEGHLRKYT